MRLGYDRLRVPNEPFAHPTPFPPGAAMRVCSLTLWFAMLAVGALCAAEPERPLEKAAKAADFRGQIEPLFSRYCAKCHIADEPKGEFALQGYLERAAVVEDRQAWEKISQKLHDREMPPEEEAQPTPAELEAITSWIDGALARFDCGKERDPGRVTIRRLNRNEYNNTIRDLLGVDFHPADDFPSDDVGYGFDNIGDVLSMPPILLEKYLAAAEKIAERTLGSEQVNLVTGETTGGEIIEGGQRILTHKAEVRTKLRMFGEGDYMFRVRAYGEQAGDEPVKMALYLDNKLVREFDVKAVVGKPQVYEAWLATKGGQHAFSVVFLNDYYEPEQPAPNDRNLVIDNLEVMGPYPPTFRRVIPREHTPDDKMLLARESLNALSARAFRRPSRASEVDRLLKLVELSQTEGENFNASMALALQAILVSPHFLFRVELDPQPNEPKAVRTLNDYELATRLSYFLWSSMPDDELFAQARLGTLRQADNLEKQVRRMLADSKAQALVENFAGQWLQLRNLRTAAPDKAEYPTFDEPLRAAMQRETELFFDAILREDRSVLEFLDADYTFVNGRLARHYGMTGIDGDTFRRVPLDRERRGGVLGHASVLTVTSNPTRTSPVKRGKWVLENLLGAAPPPPPPDVPPLVEQPTAAATGSLRERMVQHRAKADCAICHNRMDPLGFGLENYDGIGAWRTAEGKFPIDASGVLPNGQSFSGPRELKAVLVARQDEFVRCLAEKMLTYGLGRGVEYSDKCTVADIAKTMRANDYKFSSMIVAIVESDAFQKRRGAGDKP
jgi:mono/diheme cytochrome c family protein